MTQLIKTSNSGTISQYFTYCCNNIMYTPIHSTSYAARIRDATFVQRLAVHTSYVTLIYNSTNGTVRFFRPTIVIYYI